MTFVAIFMIVTGYIMNIIAKKQLGISWHPKAYAIQLVTTGLYKYIANPIYVAAGFVVLGISLLITRRCYLVLLIMLLYTVVQTCRVKRERRVLTEVFGQQYKDYLKQVWF